MSGRALLLCVLLAAGLLAAPFVVYPVFLMKLLCFALFACAFNLLLGFTGLLSFGHAAFFGFAAYVAGHAAKVWELGPAAAVLAGTLTAAALGALFGALAIRRQGIYFAMVTLALAQMVYFLCLQAPFTGGENGLQAIPRGHLFGLLDLTPNLTLYYVVLAVVVAALALIWRAVHSPFGHVLQAIRENEARAVSLGYSVDRHKFLAFLLSATLSGLAGSLKALVFQVASLTDVDWHMSGEVVLMALIGGIGTVFGPAFGALVIVMLQDYFAALGAWVTIIQGVIFIACVLAFRRGIWGTLLAWRERPPRPSRAPPAQPESMPAATREGL